MRTSPFVSLGALAAAALASPLLSAAPATPTYLLSMKLLDGDRVVGTPELKVPAGSPARIEVGERGGNWYSVGVTASPGPGTTVKVVSTIAFVSTDGVRRTANPTLLVRLGEPAVISFGEDSATAKPLRIDLLVREVAG